MINRLSQNLNKYIELLNQKNTKPHLIVLFFLLLIGFLLRMYGAYAGQGYHAFAINDELEAYRYALNYLAGDEKAQYLGQPAFAKGQAPGPVWTLFWILLLKLGNNSIDGAIYWMAILNSCVIFLFYKLANQFLEPKYALFVALLYATAPWPVYYSVGVWNPMPMAFLGALLFLSLWHTTRNENSRSIIWVCLLAAIIPQFHMIGIFYIPAILLILYITPVKLNKQWFLVGMIAGLIIYAPYLIGDFHHGWENTRKMLSGGGGFSFSVLKIISAPATVLSSMPGRWAGETIEELQHFGDSIFGTYIILLAFAAISSLAGLIFIVKFIKNLVQSLKGNWLSLRQVYSNYPELLFIGILVVIPLLLFLFTGHNYATRYTIIIFPLLFLFPAYLYQGLKTSKTQRLWGIYFAVMVIFNIYLLTAFFTYQNNMIENSDKFMASFRKMEQIRQLIELDAGSEKIISLEFDESINKLPEINRKTIYALGDYIDIYQQKVSHKSSRATKQLYFVTLNNESSRRSEKAIFHGNGIQIIPSL